MADNIIDFFSRFGLVALIVFGLFSFIVIVQSDNSAVQPLTEDSRFSDSFSNISEELADLEDTSQDQWDALKQEKSIVGFGSIVLFTPVNIGKTFGSLVFAMFELIIKLPVIILGIPLTVTSVLLSWLIISIVSALWIFWKLGG